MAVGAYVRLQPGGACAVARLRRRADHRRRSGGAGRHRLRRSQPEDQGHVSRRRDPGRPVLMTGCSRASPGSLTTRRPVPVSTRAIELLGWRVERPVDKYLLVLAILAVFDAGGEEPGAGPHRARVDGNPRYGCAAEVIGIPPLYASSARSPSGPFTRAWPARCGVSSTSARGSRRPSA